MTIRITFFGGRVEEYTEVRYTSTYPDGASGPRLMRIEFLQDAIRAKTIELETVTNISHVIPYKPSEHGYPFDKNGDCCVCGR